MRRHAFNAIGLLAAVLGTTVMVDTVFAQGCCCCCCGGGGGPCPNQTICCDSITCLTPAVVCNGQNATVCLDNYTQKFEVGLFPKSISPISNLGTKVDEPLSNCSRPTGCKLDNLGNCSTAPGNNVWQSAAKKTTVPC